MGNGDGTFQPQQIVTTGGLPGSVSVGDVNGDGKLDIAVANYDDNNVGLLLGSGNGNFTGQSYTIDD
jgi:hypothetical protein